jgi:hypothetical protein
MTAAYDSSLGATATYLAMRLGLDVLLDLALATLLARAMTLGCDKGGDGRSFPLPMSIALVMTRRFDGLGGGMAITLAMVLVLAGLLALARMRLFDWRDC